MANEQNNKTLIIVESPTKARTITKYLGNKYIVLSSMGHIIDLPKSRLAIDIEHDFQPEYITVRGRAKLLKELKKKASLASNVLLATDPDREGEAIAWHLIAAAEIEESRAQRVVFHEITERAIQEAFAHPRQINMPLVNAQQARRILDRLVGYNITELLWDKVRNRLSAGRVQTVALRLVVVREREIEAFVPEEYWTRDAELAKLNLNGSATAPSFVTRLMKIAGELVDFHVEDDVRPHLETLEKSQYVVQEVKRGTRQRRPAPPFTTSTLQQEASQRLGFSARRTMQVAQALYEGIDINGGTVGLITYMRTDSTTVAAEAQHETSAFIREQYGKDFAPSSPPIYRKKAKSAQEAHEAIRPTSVYRTPDSIKHALTGEQLRLYTLIWQRFVASQMVNAVYATQRVDILAGPADEPQKPYLFRVSGSVVQFPGFLRVYEETREDNAIDEDLNRVIPDLEPGEILRLLRLLPEQHFTQPPPRYTEATLVKALEEKGIGRPSTYAPTVAVIQNRDYVIRKSRQLVPTPTGLLVNDLLVKHFPDVMDPNFTAQLESRLDQIAAGGNDWVPMLREFYGPFSEQLDYARRELPSQRQMETVGRDCPECGSPLILRYSRFGKFIGCSRYPECRYKEPWLEKTGVACPRCGGELVEKRSKKGRRFYGCVNFPTCDFTSWKRPLPTPCPNCGGLLVDYNKQYAECIQCKQRVEKEEAPEPSEMSEQAF
jgi:DNA topoisomerase-1